MTTEQVSALGPSFTEYLRTFKSFFVNQASVEHMQRYCHGLISDLPRKSVEPIALAAGCAVRTLQQFLVDYTWNHGGIRDEIQRRIVRDHLPAPGERPKGGIGIVGWIDETSAAKKGDKTPGVQRQYCGATGKIDNCIVTVHLACRCGDFMTLLDRDLFLPEETWDQDRDRCREAHIPDDVVYRSKWEIALEQITRAMGNGVRFDWLTFDEWYGGKPGFLAGLEGLGQLYVCEVPSNLPCFSTYPKYKSKQRSFSPKRVDNAGAFGKPFKGKPWKKIKLARKTLPPQVWEVRTGQVYLARDGKPTQRTYWLIVARNAATGEIKYFISNAPARTALLTLMKIAFTRAGVEHVFRLAKTEIGFAHFEGRSYRGLMRHMTLCQLVLLFAAEQTDRLRGEKSGSDDRTDRQGIKHGLPILAPAPVQAIFH